MLSKVLAFSFIAAAYAAVQLQVLAPGPDVWWVAGNQNVIAWGPCPGMSGLTGFNVVIENKDQTVLAGNFTVIAAQPYDECSHLYTPPSDSLKIAPGYIIHLTDSLNISNVIASATFDIKDINSAGYPPTTREPLTITSSTTGSASTASQTGNSTQSSNNNSGAMTITISLAVALMGLVNAVLEGAF